MRPALRVFRHAARAGCLRARKLGVGAYALPLPGSALNSARRVSSSCWPRSRITRPRNHSVPIANITSDVSGVIAAIAVLGTVVIALQALNVAQNTLGGARKARAEAEAERQAADSAPAQPGPRVLRQEA